jgi:HlyD family secretion protein
VDVEVDESDVAALTAGEQARFKVDAYPHETFHGSLVQVRLQPVLTAMTNDPRSNPSSPSAATTAAGSAVPASAATVIPTTATGAAATTGGATVVSYTAIVRVENPDRHLLPGMTAIVTIDALHRDNAVRIPNGALSFHPSLEILRALNEDEPVPASYVEGARQRDWREVWTYDGHALTPLLVRPGLADDAWTELVGGPLASGDALVTGAALERGPKS